MQRVSLWFMISILMCQLLIIWTPPAIADNDANSAQILPHDSTIVEWLCYEDCDGEPIDQTDWFRFDVNASEPVHIYINNLNDFSSVELVAELYMDDVSTVYSSMSIGSNDNESFFVNSTSNTVGYISISAIDGFSLDGTNYTITSIVERDNTYQKANLIDVGAFLDVGYVCIEDCEDDYFDPEDWYIFTAEAGDNIGIVAEEISWFSVLDFEVFILLQNGTISSFDYDYYGGSSGGPEESMVRAWFNVTTTSQYLVRVYTDEPDEVLYNLSINRGNWVDIEEDDFHFISFPEFSIGDTLRAQAIRTNVPNDLDILLLNNSEFNTYREMVVDNGSESPEEILAVQDCLICSIEFTLTPELTGLSNARPSTTHSIDEQISWKPSLYFVADYTDYRSNPPGGQQVDIASVFLAISILESDTVSESYEVYSVDNEDNLQLFDSGVVTNGLIQPPQEGWNFNYHRQIGDMIYSDYNLVVRDSGTNAIHSNSSFRVFNHVPSSCFEISGSLEGTYISGLPISLSSSCSTDKDGDNLMYTWYINEQMVSQANNANFTSQVGEVTIRLKVEDVYGFADNSSMTISVFDFPVDSYSNITNVNLTSTNQILVDSVNVIYENSSVSHDWTEWSIVGSRIGIGINVQSRIIQYSSVNLVFENTDGDNYTVSSSTEMSKTNIALNLSLSMILQNIETGEESEYLIPMPSIQSLYEGQSWVLLPSLTSLLQTVYVWDTLATIHDGEWVNGFSDTAEFSISVPTIDLMNYLNLLVGLIPGAQTPLLFASLAIDYNLFLDIELDFEINSNGDIILYKENNEGSEMSSDELAVEVNNQTIEEIYPFTELNAETIIEGSINLRLRIAQPGWLTFGLGFLVDDPMFLEGMWNATLSDSNEPLVENDVLNYMLSNHSLLISKPDLVQDNIEDNTSQNDDSSEFDNSSQTNQTVEGNNSTEGNSTDTNRSNGEITEPVFEEQENDDSSGGIQAPVSEEQLESDLISDNSLIYTGISTITLVFVGLIMLFRMRRRRKKKASIEQVPLMDNMQNQYPPNW